MKKSVEVEYVGMDDVIQIMMDAVSLTKLGMFASVQVSNYNSNEDPLVSIYIHPSDASKMKKDEVYKYSFNFRLYSDDSSDVADMNECKCLIDNLFVQKGKVR